MYVLTQVCMYVCMYMYVSLSIYIHIYIGNSGSGSNVVYWRQGIGHKEYKQQV